MANAPASSGCNYAQAMCDRTPVYDNAKRARKCGKCGKKPCVCRRKK
jgi:hypothetical protein